MSSYKLYYHNEIIFIAISIKSSFWNLLSMKILICLSHSHFNVIFSRSIKEDMTTLWSDISLMRNTTSQKMQVILIWGLKSTHVVISIKVQGSSSASVFKLFYHSQSSSIHSLLFKQVAITKDDHVRRHIRVIFEIISLKESKKHTQTSYF